MLKIENLHVSVDGKPILKGIDLQVDEGETHILLGPNGGGKTTLLMSILGMPRYEVTQGRIIFNDRDITHMTLDERARLGIGMMFQKPPAVRGVKLAQIADIAAHARGNNVAVAAVAERLNLEEHMDRDLNYGFSGGELKRSELLQLICQNPELVLLDEPESGVDMDNISLIGNMINELLHKDKIKGRKVSGIIVTHTGYILEYVNADKGHILMDGRIVCSGGARDIFDEVRLHGFGRCEQCQ
ncbi:ABC transporter ATP-binding protein [Mahella australiensis]|uniref:Iron-regulated ABC transporter ATPase subunit SufC n=1 Tax=Mahella australiensis (strain DSM 15567 / CIP 107919 / 50-1 BON) TaxID=697281 RepID=F3ZW89_MAHA5|nr:ABC transporter ATP-binding protein [Mahella australiensis]AEE97498.1 Iron-regulated ABC transporter ATPase subunit SufC [Mahella australiensis 50-1 BON]